MMSAVPEGWPGTPCQHWHNTWGGLTSCLLLCPHFHFAASPPPFFRPQILGSIRSLFIFSFMCPCCLPLSLWLGPFWILQSHTLPNPLHFHKCSTSINRMKGARRKEEVHRKGIKKRTRRNGLAKSHLPFFFKHLFPFSLPTDIVFVCACVAGQVCGRFKTSV